jgi:hypothetical protein
MGFPTSKRTPLPRYARLDGKPLAKPRGRHAGRPPDTVREVVTIPVHQRLGFRVAEFAALVGVSTTTIWRQIKSGQIEVIQQHGMKIIPRSYAVRAGYISDNA